MNLLCYSIKVLFTLLLIYINIHKVVNSSDERLQNYLRRKRVYKGEEVAGKFQYVVFIKSLLTSIDKQTENDCEEKICTGTLVHERFVLTIYSCIVSSYEHLEIIPENIKIFSKYRPYTDVKENMTYNIAEEIKFVTPETRNYWDSDNIALIKMNETFPEVKTFPKVMDVDPVPDGLTLSCTTVGYSLIGRDLLNPTVQPIGPMSYAISVQFSLTECYGKTNIYDSKDQNPYMCYMEPNPIDNSLCANGDEGSPLLCTQPQHPAQPVGEGGLYLYGLANVVPDCKHAGVVEGHTNWTEKEKVLFLYILKYGVWINQTLTDYDENAANPGLTNPTKKMLAPSTTTETLTTTTTVLPEYYDTGEYDEMRKHQMKCKGARIEGSVSVATPAPGILAPLSTSSVAVLSAVALWYTTSVADHL